MNKTCFLLLLLLLLTATSISAQSFVGSGNDYTNVISYDGVNNSRSFTARVESNVPFNFEKGWKLSVKAISQNSKKEFPLHRLSLRPHAVEGSASDPGPLPTLAQLGIAPINILNKNAEVFLIPSSSVPLFHRANNSSYFNFNLLFDLVVEGGNYLNSLKGDVYEFYLVFTFYSSDNRVLGVINRSHVIQVSQNLSGTPPTENNFSIQISSAAKNGVLEVKSMSDYINGASVKYDKGIIVSSNVSYQLTVKSMQNEFKSDMGNTLPLDVVSVKLSPNSSNVNTINEVKISTSPQILLKGGSTNSLYQYMDLIYSTKGNDERLFKTKSENYSATLTYEMTVQ